MKRYRSLSLLIISIGYLYISCDDAAEEYTMTNIHFIIANERVIDDSIDIKILFDDSLLVDGVFTFPGHTTDYQFRDVTVPKGEYLINVRSEAAQKERKETYNFHEDDYWFLIFYWNPKSPNNAENEFHFTIHNDIIKVG